MSLTRRRRKNATIADWKGFSDAEDSNEKEFSDAEDSKKKQRDPMVVVNRNISNTSYQLVIPSHPMSKQDEGPQGGSQQKFPPNVYKQHKSPGHQMSSQVNVSIYIGVVAIVLFVAYYIHQSQAVHNRLVNVETAVNKLKEYKKCLDEIDELEREVKMLKNNYEVALGKKKELDEEIQGSENRLKEIDKKLDRNEGKLKEVTSSIEKQSKRQVAVEERVRKNEDSLIKQVSRTEELVKLKSDAKDVQEKMVQKKMEQTIEYLSEKEDRMKKQMDAINEKVSKSDKKVGELKHVLDGVKSYTDQQLLQLRTKLLEVEKTANFPYYCVADIFEAVAILVLVVLMKDFLNPSPVSDSLEPTRLSSSHTRSVDQSVLSRIYRAPVLENNICIISFYQETMSLHKSMLSAVLQMRQPTYPIVQCYIRQHDDILNIPSCRYIFVFVDYNERNIILENPGQDLGDKKLITVQAACKIGATVFVTYVRDRGSRLLPPGALYNTELSSFTSHFELKKLTQQSRCFSVYESYSQTQKDQILEAIRVNN